MTAKHTMAASYLGYVTQAAVNNLAPLLFLSFQQAFDISLGQITLLITMNFCIQLLVDLASTRFVDRIGYRASAVMGHAFCFLGFLMMGSLPFLLPSPYAGLVIAMAVNAIGGGLLEVIVSPIVEAIPGERKAASMSLLHSFYCWGHVGVVLLSTLYFSTIGADNWRWLPLLWSLLPLCNGLFFLRVPLWTLVSGEEQAIPLRKLFTKQTFLILFLLMLCAGASEQAMSQWASMFAEQGLQVSKTLGDLLGPCLFAVLMGLSRLFFGSRFADRFQLENILLASAVLCIASYLLAAFAPVPLLALLGCGLCGLSVGALWPGTFSLASKRFPLGGTAMFAILALAGDAGCASGPSVVGAVSSMTSFQIGLMAAIVFPLVLISGVFWLKKDKKLG